MIGAPIGSPIGEAFPYRDGNNKALSAGLTLDPALTTASVILRYLTATIALTALRTRTALKSLAAGFALSVSAAKTVSAHLTAALSLSTQLIRLFEKVLFAALSFSARTRWLEILKRVTAGWGSQAENGGVWTRQSPRDSGWE